MIPEKSKAPAAGRGAGLATETEQSAPNFLVILTDDQGPWAVTKKMPELVTPTLDGLVSQSSTFENFYCASPVCSPARASLLTGRMPSAHGVHDWIVGERHPDAADDVYLGGLANLPETLERNGYTCAMSGKWHVGTSRRPAPGFDYWYAHRLGGGPYYGAPIWDENGQRIDEERYFTYAVAEEAAGFIDQITQRPDQKPFYLQVNFTAPHDPWINSHPSDLYDLYKDCDFPSVPRLEPHPWTIPNKADFADAFADPQPFLQGYAASLSGVDRGLKLLLDRLDEHGIRDNTVIIYMADNGFSCGHHGVWGKGNGTFPLNFWENSVRVPFFISLPGQTQAYQVDEHISATSFFSTICELAQVPVPQDPLRAGESFAHMLGRDVPEETENPVMVFDEYGGGRMIRCGKWKFIDRYQGPRELYNLDNDPDEVENLVDAEDYQSTVSELADRLSEWFAQHETAMDRAFHRPVRGRGQIHPPRKGLDDEHTYVLQNINIDGNRDQGVDR